MQSHIVISSDRMLELMNNGIMDYVNDNVLVTGQVVYVANLSATRFESFEYRRTTAAGMLVLWSLDGKATMITWWPVSCRVLTTFGHSIWHDDMAASPPSGRTRSQAARDVRCGVWPSESRGSGIGSRPPFSVTTPTGHRDFDDHQAADAWAREQASLHGSTEYCTSVCLTDRTGVLPEDVWYSAPGRRHASESVAEASFGSSAPIQDDSYGSPLVLANGNRSPVWVYVPDHCPTDDAADRFEYEVWPFVEKLDFDGGRLS